MATTPVSLAIFDQSLGVLDAVGDRNLDQHMLAGAHHLLALAEMHLGRRGQDHRVGALDALGQLAGEVRDAVFLGDLRVVVLIAADQRGDLDARRIRFSASRCFCPNAPCPATQIFISASRLIFRNVMAELVAGHPSNPGASRLDRSSLQPAPPGLAANAINLRARRGALCSAVGLRFVAGSRRS